MNPARRMLASVLLLGLLVAPFAGARNAFARGLGPAKSTPPRPVILVHGLGGSKEKSFGWQKPRSFYQWMLDAGYEEGRTLFAFDYSSRSSGDYVEIARDLGAFVQQVVRLTGCSSVDIISHSMGALVSRKCLTSQEAAGGSLGSVENLVMISPPNHGSFAASAAAVERQVLYHESVLSGVSGEAPEGRQGFVAARACDTYEPLYAEFARQRMWGPAQLHTSAETFEEWIARTKPDVCSRLLGGDGAGEDQGSMPEARSGDLAGGMADASPEEGLTSCYYEYVALNVGRNNYLRRKESPSSLIRLVAGVPKETKGLPLALIRDALLRAVDPLIKKALTWVKSLLLKTSGRVFGIDVEEPAILRMVEERLKFPSGRSEGRVLYDALPANWYLADLNESLEGRRSVPSPGGNGPRYLIYGAKAPNLAGVIWRTVDANDMAVELESSYIRPMPDDVYSVSSGLSLFHGALLSQQRLVPEITALLGGRQPDVELKPEWREGPRMFSWSSSGKLRISDWLPRYIRVSSEKAGGPCDLNVLLSGSGKRFAWVDVEMASGESRRQFLEGAGEFAITGFGAGVLAVSIGLRLEEGEGTHLREGNGTIDYTVKVTELGSATTNLLDLGHQPVPVIPSTPDTVWPSRVVTNRRAQGPGGAAAPFWEWESGDGDVRREPAEVERTFAEAGRHSITATLKDAGGLIVERHEWDVETSEPGETVALDGGAGSGSRPVIRIIAPKKWITGKPATIEVVVVPRDDAAIEVVSIEPGRQFEVTWNKPGRFPVRVTVKVRSLVGTGSPLGWRTDTYVESVVVDVLAPGSTG